MIAPNLIEGWTKRWNSTGIGQIVLLGGARTARLQPLMGEAGLEAQTPMDSWEKWQRFILISGFHLHSHFLQILSEKNAKNIVDICPFVIVNTLAGVDILTWNKQYWFLKQIVSPKAGYPGYPGFVAKSIYVWVLFQTDIRVLFISKW